jgi:hypothetical protein
MRDLAHGFFSHSPAMAGPLVALVIFFVVFVVVSIRVMRSKKADWDHDAALPLLHDDNALHAAKTGDAR